MGPILNEYKIAMIISLIFIISAITLMYYLLVYQATQKAINDYKINLIKINQ